MAAIVKQEASDTLLETLIGEDALRAETATTRCADCGVVVAVNQSWYVPRGRHPVHGHTRGICRACRDVRLDELAR
jgi:hypothetical protein